MIQFLLISQLVVLSLLDYGIRTEASPSHNSTCGFGTKSDYKHLNNLTVSENRIIGGQAAKPGQFPFMAYLVALDTVACGAVIIDDWHILTAAHCVSTGCGHSGKIIAISPERISVSIGRLSNNPATGQQPLQVSKVLIHGSFCRNVGEIRHDIAILRTKKQMHLQLTSNGLLSANRICLPKANIDDYRPNEEALVAGWGRVSDSGYPDVLQYVNVELVPRHQCRRAYRTNGSHIATDQICASSTNGRDSCDGDSGGPLFRQLKGGQYELIGIVSKGATVCATPELPTVHTQVSKYVNWIHRATRLVA